MNIEHVCPYCLKNNNHIIINSSMIVLSTPKGFIVDKDATAECMNEIVTFDAEGELIVKITKENQKEVHVVCFSDGCDGREMKFEELILNDQARVESKCW